MIGVPSRRGEAARTVLGSENSDAVGGEVAIGAGSTGVLTVATTGVPQDPPGRWLRRVDRYRNNGFRRGYITQRSRHRVRSVVPWN